MVSLVWYIDFWRVFIVSCQSYLCELQTRIQITNQSYRKTITDSKPTDFLPFVCSVCCRSRMCECAIHTNYTSSFLFLSELCINFWWTCLHPGANSKIQNSAKWRNNAESLWKYESPLFRQFSDNVPLLFPFSLWKIINLLLLQNGRSQLSPSRHQQHEISNGFALKTSFAKGSSQPNKVSFRFHKLTIHWVFVITTTNKRHQRWYLRSEFKEKT